MYQEGWQQREGGSGGRLEDCQHGKFRGNIRPMQGIHLLLALQVWRLLAQQLDFKPACRPHLYSSDAGFCSACS
jgi:hypothetical protein